jgi:hypothetical protein
MKKEQIKTALTGLITKKETPITPPKEKSKDTSKEIDLPSPKNRRGFGKIQNFYFYDEDIARLNAIIEKYNKGKNPQDRLSKSNLLRMLISNEYEKYTN